MNPEIEDLVKIYRNPEEYQQCIADAVKSNHIAEALNLQDKRDFKKNRQRAELLKQNEIFLKELSAIKNRLGEKFLKLMEENIAEDALDGPGRFFSECEGILLKSDFAEPTIVISNIVMEEDGGGPRVMHWLPGTPEDIPGNPDSEIEIMPDPFFGGDPLEMVFVGHFEEDFVRIGTPSFEFKCKVKVFENYWLKWFDFTRKWHISDNWTGDLQDLHLHALPSVIVEREDANNPNLPVSIHLSAWATREDVEEAWASVEQLMKEARVYRERESKNFLRDHIWYQLNKKEGMSPLSIARFWAEKFPKEIDLEIIEKVTRDEDTFEGVPLGERLEEALSDDPKLAELRGRFIEARKAFIRIGLKDKVKKSIIKTEQKIKRIGSEDWDRNRLRLSRPLR